MGSPPRPSVSNKEIVDAYDRMATLYDRVVAPLEAGTRERAISLLSVDSDDCILELGCGPGHALVSFARLIDQTGNVIGLDAAPGMVARAHKRAIQSDDDECIDFVLGDIRSLPIAEDTIDSIFIEDTLELFGPDETRIVLEECDRVLDTEGQIGVVTMEREGAENDPFIRVYEWMYEHVPHYDRVGCRPIYARQSLEAAGFVIERRERHRRGYVWPVEILIARTTG